MDIFNHVNIVADFNTITHEEWRVLRQEQKGFGGSDAGSILGVNKYKSPAALYMEKVGEVESDAAGEAAEWGNILEPVVADYFAKRHPEYKVMEFKYLLQSKEHPFMFANVDRLLIDNDGKIGLYEGKTASSYVANDWADGAIPPSYYAQFQHYLAVLGLDWGFFGVLIGGNKFEERYVERNEDFINLLIEKEALFWQRIELGLPPELDGSEASEKLIKKLFPHVEVVDSEDKKEIDQLLTIEGDDEFGELLLRKLNLSDEIKGKTSELKEVDNKIKAFIGTKKYGVWEGFKATFREQEGKVSVDTKLLQEKFPDAYNECLKQGSSFRVLTVSKPKKVAVKS
jgi:putative phage-type endonuclease